MSFDYVIVGGGTAGLVVAARLSEDPNVTVCVLEAGDDVTHTKEATVPAMQPQLWEKDTNWGFKSTPQKHANGFVLQITRGRGLGGSSMANSMQLNRAPAHEYDALEKLGNKGWNAKEIHKYFVKSQSIAYNEKDVKEFGLKPNSEDFGNGPVINTLSRQMMTYDPFWIKAFGEKGVPYNTNAMGGETLGTWLSSLSIHPETATRISSATAYYEPNKSRKNLTVFTGAHVTRLLLKKNEGREPVAEGVEYSKGGKMVNVYAKKEVILAAGTIQTPQILELSGIGRSDVLEKCNIPTVVELPGVGENFREFSFNSKDHPGVIMSYELKPGHESYDALRTDPDRLGVELVKYTEKQEGFFSSMPMNYAFLTLDNLGDAEPLRGFVKQQNWLNIPGDISKLQDEWVQSDYSSQIEVFSLPFFFPTVTKAAPEPEKQYITVIPILLHPYSRGTIHIESSDPFKYPVIDLSILDNDYDIGALLQAVKFVSEVMTRTEAFKNVAANEVAPGENVTTDEELVNYIKSSLCTSFHPIGTAAMMKREDGGVVDDRLRVYGVNNLRIVDASILPFQLSTHPQATVYAIGEKAADMIKEDNCH